MYTSALIVQSHDDRGVWALILLSHKDWGVQNLLSLRELFNRFGSIWKPYIRHCVGPLVLTAFIDKKPVALNFYFRRWIGARIKVHLRWQSVNEEWEDQSRSSVLHDLGMWETQLPVSNQNIWCKGQWGKETKFILKVTPGALVKMQRILYCYVWWIPTNIRSHIHH